MDTSDDSEPPVDVVDVVDRVAEIRAQWAEERPELDTSGMAIVGRVSRLARALEGGIAPTLADSGLQPHEFDVLATLRRSGPPFELHPQELLDQTMVTSSTMTHRLTALEERGLVSRRPSATDRRRVIVALTSTGRAVTDRAAEAHFANERRLVGALDHEQRLALEQLLARLAASLGV